MTPSRPLVLQAEWVLPVASPPIRDGSLLIGSDGRIARLGPRAEVPVPDEARVIELGAATLLPGLVNVHTHLELTGFEANADGLEFSSWIGTIRARKEARSGPEYDAAARMGLEECWAGGVTTVADTGDSGSVPRVLAELGGSGLAYLEVFGPDPRQAETSFNDLVERVRAVPAVAGARVRVGVSPHAAYTVSGPLFARVARWAREEGLPLAVHLAESAAESDLVVRGSGPFSEAWARRGIPPLADPAQRSAGFPEARLVPLPASPVGWLGSLGVLGPETLCIHAVDLSDFDVRTLSDSGAAVAHCPVSNLRHGHGTARLGAMREAGIRVGLGTDSVASVGRLDLFAEMRAAREGGGLSDPEALALGTREGARALGLDRELGTLEPGKWGDVAVLRGAPPAADPVAGAVGSGPDDVMLTVLAGRVVYQALEPGSRSSAGTLQAPRAPR